MAITRWNPAQDIQNLQNQMNRLFEPFFRDFAPGFTTPDLTSGTWVPPVDVEETKDRIFVRAELPGMKKEDIEISFENGVLTLRGERRMEQENRERNFHRVERSYGSFVRSFTLPNSVDPEHVEAIYEDGVLEISMPKREEAKPRRIEIGGSGGPKAIDTRAKSA
ncbi:MAG: Hsp20/alpha crystallin family protein [Thermoanaerobaculia bacterium]